MLFLVYRSAIDYENFDLPLNLLVKHLNFDLQIFVLKERENSF